MGGRHGHRRRESRSQTTHFFEFADTPVPWNGEVTENVAAVFGIMLAETAKCSRALNWVPRPPSGVASIAWLATQAGMAVWHQVRGKLATACARSVIRIYRADFDMATRGAAIATAVRWA